MAVVSRGSDLSGVPLTNRLLLAQDFLLVAAITTLVLAAVTTERERVEAELRSSERASRAMVRIQHMLGQLATGLLRETPLTAMFEQIATAVGELAGARSVAILRNEGLGRTSTVATWEGPSPDGSGDGASRPDLCEAVEVHGIDWGRLEVTGAGDESLPVAAFARLLGIAITNAEAREALINRAASDPLTGLANHRTFHERLAEEMSRCRRYGRMVALAIIDIDNFKSVNDSQGHQAGDVLLSAVAARIASVMRNDAVVARLGGDEFAVLLPESDNAHARAAAERARAAVAQLAVDSGFPISISAGVCDSDQTKSPDELVERADSALYAAKAAGRNCCMAYSS